MKAITHNRYGGPDVLKLEVVDMPVVSDGKVLVRVLAASLNPADWHFMSGTPYLIRLQAGLRTPKRSIQGIDFAGRVEAVGKDVTQFQSGDEVFGGSGGSFAEYICVSENSIVKKPANVTFEHAAAVPIAAMTALQGLRDKGRLQPGQKVLINGAAGGVGTFAVQIAKALGAEVTGVCSTRNVEMVRSLGSDHVIDYKLEDFAAGNSRYDLLIDNVGNRSLRTCRSVLSPKGIYVVVGGPKNGNWVGPITHLAKAIFAFMFVSQRAVPFIAKQTKADLLVLKELLELGKIRSVIDRRFDLKDTADAFRYLELGHTQGKIIITP